LIETEKQISLVLLDWNMPKVDGLHFLKVIRSLPEYAALPVVMVTSEAARYHVVEALQAGANDYLVKPINKSLFLKKIAAYLI
jgi:two-component system chemotaxis response regulator CheY